METWNDLSEVHNFFNLKFKKKSIFGKISKVFSVYEISIWKRELCIVKFLDFFKFLFFYSLKESKREGYKKLADEDALQRIKYLEEQNHNLQKQVQMHKQVSRWIYVNYFSLVAVILT